MGDKTLPILMIVFGGLLLYCAVKNKSPAEVIKETLSGEYGSKEKGITPEQQLKEAYAKRNVDEEGRTVYGPTIPVGGVR